MLEADSNEDSPDFSSVIWGIFLKTSCRVVEAVFQPSGAVAEVPGGPKTKDLAGGR